VAFPEKINVRYVKKFYSFIKKEIKRKSKFVIVCGGGYTTRKYQRAAAKITKVTNEDKDWIGIHSTRLNAHFLRTVFRKESAPMVFDKRFKLKGFNRHSIIIGAGWSPGWSTDYVAVQIAVDLKIGRVIVLGKPDYVYTADFEKYKKARPIKNISWKNYLKLIPAKWSPGLYSPVDPIAARLAMKKKIEVVVADGKKLDNLKKIMDGQKFKGTTIS
jgi:uridylate kinase